MRTAYILAAVSFLALAKAQHFLAPAAYNLVGAPVAVPQPGIIYDGSAVNTRQVAHRAVVENAAMEAAIPDELINPFYKNPAIAAGLAKESWFVNKEFPVLNRAAEKIPRSEILKIAKRAGWYQRR